MSQGKISSHFNNPRKLFLCVYQFTGNKADINNKAEYSFAHWSVTNRCNNSFPFMINILIFKVSYFKTENFISIIKCMYGYVKDYKLV